VALLVVHVAQAQTQGEIHGIEPAKVWVVLYRREVGKWLLLIYGDVLVIHVDP